MPVPRSDSPAAPHGQRALAAQYVSSLIGIARWQLLAAVVIMTFTS